MNWKGTWWPRIIQAANARRVCGWDLKHHYLDTGPRFLRSFPKHCSIQLPFTTSRGHCFYPARCVCKTGIPVIVAMTPQYNTSRTNQYFLGYSVLKDLVENDISLYFIFWIFACTCNIYFSTIRKRCAEFRRWCYT